MLCAELCLLYNVLRPEMKEQRFVFPNFTFRPLAVRLKPSELPTLLEVALTSSFYFVVPLSLSSAF